MGILDSYGVDQSTLVDHINNNKILHFENLESVLVYME